jgi:TolB-like protein/tetratricopeptide (TPR) repeat protein
MALFEELKRRKVFKVGGAYVVLAWLAVQVASIVLPTFEAPLWVLRVVILLLALGFPIAVVMAWLLEATPEGLKVEPAGVGNKRVIGAAAAVAGLAVLWYFVGQPAVRNGAAPAAREPPAETAAAAETAPAAPKVSRNSIAVLAFADMSADGKSEYLGDGIAEEILNALAKVDGLKVAGRTSSFHYKGRNEDLREIGKALGVANVLEGSVRRQGDQVRITAQLVRADDGFHLWSETFPGTMDDVFALQERIAREVAGKLQVVLSGEQSKQLVKAGTSNPDAYALYLQASLIFNRRQGPRMPEGRKMLEQAIALDPKYARAWARLASMHVISPNYRTIAPATMLASVQDAARHASELDPMLGEPHAATALALVTLRRYREGLAEFDKALQLEPDDITANVWKGIALAQLGYRKEGNQSLDRALEIDPMLPIALLWRGMSHAASGELDVADRQLQLAEESNLAFVGLGRSQVALLRGDASASAEQFLRAFRVLARDFDDDTLAVFGRACTGDAAARPEARARVERYLDTKPRPLNAASVYVLFCVGEEARGLELYSQEATSNDALVAGALFRGLWPKVFALDSFPEAARRIGWAEFWEAKGAPDRCRKAANGDWHCS